MNSGPTTATVRLTILGSSSSIPRPGRACSAYLIEIAGRAIVADMGTGSLSNLHRYRSAETIDAVVISHMHADHFLDVIPMRYALKYGPRSNDRKVRLLLPPDGDAMLRRLCDVFVRESPDDFLDVFTIETYDRTATLRLGEVLLRFAPTSHYIPTYALRCAFEDRSVTYTADTAPDAAVAALGHGTDLFLCEATLRPNELEVGTRGHSSAAEAATMASKGEVRKLILTHYPSSTDSARLLQEAGAHYDGDLAVADDRSQYTVD